MSIRLNAAAGLLAAAVATLPSPAAAQTRLLQRSRAPESPPARSRPALSLPGGPAPYDFSRTGTGVFGALRIEAPASRSVIIEPGLTVFRYTSEVGDKITYLLTEVSVHLQAHAGPVRPYLGGGIGFSEYLSGRGKSYLTLNAAGGLRVAVGGGCGLRGEARARTIDPFSGKSVELGFGVSRSLGR